MQQRSPGSGTRNSGREFSGRLALLCLLIALAPGTFASDAADRPRRNPAVAPQSSGQAATRAKSDRSRRQNRLPTSGTDSATDESGSTDGGDSNPTDSTTDPATDSGDPEREALDPEEERRRQASIQGFLNPFIKDLMSELRVPGAAIAIVRRDRVFMLQGYGFGDLTNKARVDAIRTRFPVGRVSAALTAVAVLHAHDRGLIALGAPADSYLEDPLPRPLGKRITVEDLLLRDTGFAAVVANGGYASPGLAPGLDEYLRRTRPAYNRRDAGPSDYEINLLGRILERQSRLRFAEHLEQFFFRPIGMNRSSFVFLKAAENSRVGENQPADDRDAPAGQARPYRYESGTGQNGAGRFVRLPTRYFAPAPALGLSTTAGDMSRYLVMLLNDGRFGQARLLAKDSARRMLDIRDDDRFYRPTFQYGLEPLLAEDPQAQAEPPVARRALVTRGDLPGFTSALLIAPEKEYGVFLVANTGSPEFRERILSAFLERFAFR